MGIVAMPAPSQCYSLPLHSDLPTLLKLVAACSCMPAYTHPTSQATGVLNLANHLPWYVLKPDLGPKGYIAYGR